MSMTARNLSWKTWRGCTCLGFWNCSRTVSSDSAAIAMVVYSRGKLLTNCAKPGVRLNLVVLIDVLSLNSRPSISRYPSLTEWHGGSDAGNGSEKAAAARWNASNLERGATIRRKQVRMDCSGHTASPAPSLASKNRYELARNDRLMDLVHVTTARWRITFLRSSIATSLPSVANTKRIFLNGRPSRGSNWRARWIAPLFPVGISPVLQLTLRFWRAY